MKNTVISIVQVYIGLCMYMLACMMLLRYGNSRRIEKY